MQESVGKTLDATESEIMTKDSSIHWTDDAELLSRFVLRQLPPDEENRLSPHLSSCKHCSRAVDEERRLVAGTKLAGRADLKRRLKSRLETHEQQGTPSLATTLSYRIPWTRVLSVAAATSIIIVVGVYNNWFSANYWNEASRHEQVAQEPPTRVAKPTQTNQNESGSNDQDLQEKDYLQANGATKNNQTDKRYTGRATTQKEQSTTQSRDAREQSAKSIATTPNANAGEGAASIETMKADDEMQMHDQATVTTPEGFWVEGNVVSNSSLSVELPQEAPQPIQAEEHNMLARRSSETKKTVQLTSKTHADNMLKGISCTQKPISSLPQTLQFKRGRPGKIQTFIENGDDSIRMTLYLDSALPDSELRKANVEMINDDSLVLNLSSQRIFVKLPPALQGQVNSKAKR